jgi:hypothetical protein
MGFRKGSHQDRCRGEKDRVAALNRGQSQCDRQMCFPNPRGSEEEHFTASVAELSVLLVPREEPQAHRYLRRIEELPGKGDHAVDKIRLDDILPDLPFARLVGGHGAICQDETRNAGRCKMIDEVLDPCKVRVAGGRHPVLPALVVLELVASPITVIEGRVGQHEVGLQIGVLVIVEAVAVGDLRIDPPDGEVHLRQPPRRVVGFLPVDGDIADPPAVGLNELLTADEHAARAAARVVHAALVRL